MQKAIAILMDEHRRIEQVLGSLEAFAASLGQGLSEERSLLGCYAGFFRDFADAFHHAKEEDVLFERLVESGFSRESGPVAVMLHEHQLGRAHVSSLRRLAGKGGPLSAVERQQAQQAAGAFVPLLRAHILKEDRILYPMALRVLSGPELDEMAEAFAALERARQEDGSWDRFQALAEQLLAVIPPDPALMAAAAEAGGCWAR